ncbi:MAG: hypothetical protein ACI8WB_002533 [Phenylobacterium sp.]|jgi:hypothetical protein
MTEILTRTVNTIKKRTVPVASFSLSGEESSNIVICKLSMRSRRLHYIVYEQSVFDHCSAFDKMLVVAELTLIDDKIHFIQEPARYFNVENSMYTGLNTQVAELVRNDAYVLPQVRVG